MNAPTPAAVFSKPTLQLISLDWLQPSSTHIQQLRRERFTADELKELADSIRANGVVQHPLVRPIKAASPISHEIVAGERRVLAARLAGLSEIYVSVRELDDNQVLELQLIENLQRKGLHEMEEAEGYAELMKVRKVKPEDIGDLVGKSRSYVYGRIKLLTLCPALRKDFYAGKLNASEALLLARIPNHKVQLQALEDLAQAKDNGDIVNYKEAQQFMREHYMLKLADAPFKLDIVLKDASGECPPCTDCRDRTINQPADLFGEAKSADMCTNTVCFDRKKTAVLDLRRKELQAKGSTVIDGAQAKKLKPHLHSDIGGDYIELDDERFIAGKYQKPRQVLGKDFAGEQLLQCPHTHRLIAIAKESVVKQHLADKGFKEAKREAFGGNSEYAARQKATERKNRIESAARARILKAIHDASAARQFDHADTLLVAHSMLDRLHFDSKKRLVDFYREAHNREKPKGTEYIRAFDKTLDVMTPAELGVLMVTMALIGDIHVATYYGSDKKDLEATARRLNIDPDKIRETVKAEFAEKKKASGKGGKK